MNEVEKPEVPEQVRDLRPLREHAGTRTRTTGMSPTVWPTWLSVVSSPGSIAEQLI
jgi:hypothetical protein